MNQWQKWQDELLERETEEFDYTQEPHIPWWAFAFWIGFSAVLLGGFIWLVWG